MKWPLIVLALSVAALEGYYQFVKHNEVITGVELRNYSYEDSLASTAMLLGLDALDLGAVIGFESGHKAEAVNKYTGASGLIQFMPQTAESLGVSIEQVRQMDRLGQLQLVYQYLRPQMPISNKLDLYWCIFYPAARTKTDNYVLGGNDSRRLAGQNPIFDVDKNGLIQKREVEQIIKSK